MSCELKSRQRILESSTKKPPGTAMVPDERDKRMSRPIAKFLSRAIAIFCTAAGVVSANEDRPNILWITCEDLSPRIGCYGDQTVPTPNIDGLAEQGVRYTHTFGVYGVCAPNRHCIIMGMYPNSTGAMHMRTWKRSSAIDETKSPGALTRPLYEAKPPAAAKCFTEYLRAAGYFCTNNSKTDYQFRPPITAWDHSGKQAHWRKRPNKDMPFFSVFNFTVTHESGTFKQRSKIVTDPDNVKLPAYFSGYAFGPA